MTYVIGLVVGLVLGAVLMAVIVVAVMRQKMLVVTRSSKSFDDTVAALEASIKEHGWSSPSQLDLNASMAKHGVEFKPRVRGISLCKAAYAKQVLTDERRVACLMPCTFAVYEGDDGGIYVSKMNTGLMGKVFGGTVARVMSTQVAPDEDRIMACVHGDEATPPVAESGV